MILEQRRGKLWCWASKPIGCTTRDTLDGKPLSPSRAWLVFSKSWLWIRHRPSRAGPAHLILYIHHTPPILICMSKKIKQELEGARKGYNRLGNHDRVRVERRDVETAPVSDAPPVEGTQNLRNITRLMADPYGTMDVICSFVAGGGSIINLCKTWDVAYTDVLKWIRDDKTLSARYDQAIQDRSEWTIEQLLRELRLMAMSDIRDLYDDNNCLKPVKDWPEHIARAVEAVKIDELYEGTGAERTQIGETKQVKLWSKLKAVELLGKNLKLFLDHVQVSGSVKLEDIIAGSFNDETENN